MMAYLLTCILCLLMHYVYCSCDLDSSIAQIRRWHLTLAKRRSDSDSDCIFKHADEHSIANLFTHDNKIASELKVDELASVPQSQRWSRCQRCGLSLGEQNHVLVFGNDSAKLISNLISWSQWGEFFSAVHHNDRYYGIATSSENLTDVKYIVDRPVFIIPIITFHVGHILVDVLESLYYSMMRYYGSVRTDALLIFDVSGELTIPPQGIYYDSALT
jgi:hypothetical protein